MDAEDLFLGTTFERRARAFKERSEGEKANGRQGDGGLKECMSIRDPHRAVMEEPAPSKRTRAGKPLAIASVFNKSWSSLMASCTLSAYPSMHRCKGDAVNEAGSEKPSTAGGSCLVLSSTKKPEEIGVLRKKYRLRVVGQDVPAPLESFMQLETEYDCQHQLVLNVAAAGYQEPTPIQRQALPVLLSGRECFACAPTGSGKTVAFLIPIIAGLKMISGKGIKALILCPTRELALQIHRELKKLARGCGLRTLVLSKANLNALSAPEDVRLDVLIATPLRLKHILDKGVLDLTSVHFLVLDESDKLLEMGFVEQVDAIFMACTCPNIVRALFSATLPETVEQLARSLMHDPIRIVVGERNVAASSVNQKLMFVGTEQGKLLAIRQILKESLRPPVLVFVQSKDRAKELHKELQYDGINVDVIHADRSHAQRHAAVEGFRIGKTWVLIATDVVARGMDFKGVNLVLNYDFPSSAASYIHRIGRTGRAGRCGEAITLYTEDDAPMLRAIANVMVASGSDVPLWMLELKKQRSRKLHAPKRGNINELLQHKLLKAKRRRNSIEASKKKAKLLKQLSSCE